MFHFFGSQVTIYSSLHLSKEKKKEGSIYNDFCQMNYQLNQLGLRYCRFSIFFGIHGFDLIDSPLFRSCNLAVKRLVVAYGMYPFSCCFKEYGN